MGESRVQLADLKAFCRAHGRVCPLPNAWNEMGQLLLGPVDHVRKSRPPPSLILSAWHHTSNLEKMTRLQQQLEWAAEHGILDSIDAFLRGLTEEQWHHLTRRD